MSTFDVVSAPVAKTLAAIRGLLEAVAAVVAVAYIALKAQAADADYDVAVAIQRCVIHELREQPIDSVTSQCPALVRNAPGRNPGAPRP